MQLRPRFWSREAPARVSRKDRARVSGTEVAGPPELVDPAELPKPDTSLHPVGGVSGGRGPNQLRFLEHWGLQPSSRVLEIGCGVGRLAYELASVLDRTGSYSGFDISPKAIDWLNEHYAPRLANFRFDLVDARNVRYRPRRGAGAESIRVPYGDGQFDVVCALAVFMHMPLPEIAHYFEEIDRVLTVDGFGVATFRSVRPGEVPPATRGREWVAVGQGVYSIFPETPGRALAYDDALIRDTITGAGLVIVAEIEGSWHGRAPNPSGSPALGADAFVVRRSGSVSAGPT